PAAHPSVCDPDQADEGRAPWARHRCPIQGRTRAADPTKTVGPLVSSLCNVAEEAHAIGTSRTHGMSPSSVMLARGRRRATRLSTHSPLTDSNRRTLPCHRGAQFELRVVHVVWT